MDGVKTDGNTGLGAMELLGICGFGLFFGWMLLAFYWLFAEFLPNDSVAMRDGLQLFVFLGITLGYLALHFLGKVPRFTLFSAPLFVGEAVCALLMPAAALAVHFGIELPAALLAAMNFLTGIGGALLTVSWLDACSRMKTRRYGRFCSVALVIGGLAFALVGVMPLAFQPVFCMIYLLLSVGLLTYVGTRAELDDEPPAESADPVHWKFAREVEPSIIAFGIVFGLTFVYLFNYGASYVYFGLLAVIPGAGIIAAISSRGVFLNITVMQRLLLCITVLSCLSIPFAVGPVQLACACLVVASWAFFVSMNYGHLVRKCVEIGGARTFRQIPSRVFMAALGFLIGWTVASVTTAIWGAHSSAFTVVRLCTAFIVVLVVMLFFPDQEHHDAESDLPAGTPVEKASAPVVSNLTETELFERRCAAVASLYQLSPRETDILEFLARGRNAAYIQNKLCISPHTVKSHIYSIYRKVDIHSQQKLMDFVEDYPLDADAVERK